MDDAITQYVKRAYNLLIGEQTAERIKLQIGSAFRMEQEQTMDIKGRDLIGGIPKTIKITSGGNPRHAAQSRVGAIVEAGQGLAGEARPELSSDIVDRGIVMTGGASLLRGMDSLLHETTNLPIRVAEDALCVVLGSGKILDDLETYSKVLMRSS